MSLMPTHRTEHVTNQGVLRRIGIQKELGITLKTRKYLGHLMRHSTYGLDGRRG